MKIDATFIDYLKAHFVSRKEPSTIADALTPAVNEGANLGSPSRRFDTIYTRVIVADNLTGGAGGGGSDTMDGYHAYATPHPNALLALDGAGVFPASVYPNALLRDGSRSLTGDLAVDAGIKIDGVDVSAHAGDANLHHLNGMSYDDHSMYVHNTVPRTIQAVHTIAPTTVSAPFILGANAQGQTVTGLRADQLNKQVAAGAGLTGGGYLTANLTLDVGAGNGITVAADSISVKLKTASGLEVDANGLALADALAGSGLGISNKVLAVGQGTLIRVDADAVSLAYGTAQYQIPVTGSSPTFAPAYTDLSTMAGSGLTFSAGVFNVGGSALITVNADNITLANGSATYQTIVTGGSAPYTPGWVDLTTLAGAGLDFSNGSFLVGAGYLIQVSANAVSFASGTAQYQVPVTGVSPTFTPAYTLLSDFSGAGLSFSGGKFLLGTPSSVSITSANSASGTTHSHAVISTSNPGAAASLLASATDGGLQLLRLGLGATPDGDSRLTLSSGGQIGLSAGPLLTFDGGSVILSLAGKARIVSTASPQFKLAYTDGSYEASFAVDSAGLLSITPTGGLFLYEDPGQASRSILAGKRTLNSASTVYGYNIDLHKTGTGGASGLLAFVYGDATTTGTTSAVEGGYLYTSISGAYTTPYVNGLRVFVSNAATSVITYDLTGIQARLNGVLGTVSGKTAFFYARNAISSGSLPNLYGVYVEQLSQGAANYAIYTEGSTQSYFGGSVGIGNSSPSNQLDVTGTGRFSGMLTASAGLTVTGNATMRHILPEATDTYDLGSSTRYWSQSFISQINAVIFAEQTVTLLGGWFIVGKGQGTFAAVVSSGDTSIDFGQAMTVGHFVLVRAHDSGGAIKAEYILVGTLVSGTRYNVTRDLAGAHTTDPVWSAGTVYLILGANGDGRIELNAYDTPRIQILRQGATYNAQTELARLGDLNTWGPFSAENYGWAIGDYSGNEYAYYAQTTGLIVRGTIRADDGFLGNLTVQGTLDVSTSGVIKSGAAGYNSGTGFWMDYNSGTPRYFIGNSAGEKMTWSGSALSIVGTIDANAGYLGTLTVDGTLTVGTGGVIKSGASGYDSGTGYWLEYNAGTPRVFIGNSGGNKLLWSGAALTIVGAITATSGTIGGWTINSSYLAKDTGAGSTSSGMSPTDYPFYAGATYANRASAPFRVTPAGAVTATSGTIGGWSISATSLSSDSGLVGMTTAGTIRIWAGSATPASSPFRVDNAGALVASNASITGTIDANAGYLGSLTVDGTLNVGTGGVLKSGATAYNSGTGYWMEYNAGTPRFFIGNSSGSKLTWDGSTLSVTGTIDANAGYLGTLTVDGTLTVGAGGVIKSGASGFDNGAGFWMEYNTGTPRFFLGNSTGSKVTWDGSNLLVKGVVVVTAGVSNSFEEYFQGTTAEVLARWTNVDGTGELVITTGGLAGGNLLQVGNNAGDDQIWLIFNHSIPFDPTKLYRVFARVRRTQGNGTIFLGVVGRDGTDTGWVNTSGVNSWSNQHYFAAAMASPGATWTEYVGYFKGTATSGCGNYSPDPSSPGKMYETVRYFRPMMLVNYNYAPGITEIDEFRVDIVPDTADSPWRHDGSTTTIDGGNIYTGTITADKITVTTLSALNFNTGNLTISGTLTVNSAGKIVCNTETTGILMGYLTDGYYLRGVNAGATQFEARASDGKLYAGAGSVKLDSNGISILASSFSGGSSQYYLKFVDASGNPLARMYHWDDYPNSQYQRLVMEVPYRASIQSQIDIISVSGYGRYSGVTVAARSGSSGPEAGIALEAFETTNVRKVRIYSGDLYLEGQYKTVFTGDYVNFSYLYQIYGTTTLRVDNPFQINSYLDLAEISAPSTPGSGFGRYYLKTDGLPYLKNDGGVEIPTFKASVSFPVTSGRLAAASVTVIDNYNTVLSHDASNWSFADFGFRLPHGWAGKTATLRLWWAPSDASSGNVVWFFEAMKIASGSNLPTTPTTSSYSAFASPGVAKRVSVSTMSVSLSSFGEGNAILLRIGRYGGHASDTYPSNAYLVAWELNMVG